MKIKTFNIFDCSSGYIFDCNSIVEARNRKEAVAKAYNVNMKAVRANSRGRILVTEIELKGKQRYKMGNTIGYDVLNRV